MQGQQKVQKVRMAQAQQEEQVLQEREVQKVQEAQEDQQQHVQIAQQKEQVPQEKEVQKVQEARVGQQLLLQQGKPRAPLEPQGAAVSPSRGVHSTLALRPAVLPRGAGARAARRPPLVRPPGVFPSCFMSLFLLLLECNLSL